jgi:predicted nucleotidyltransferase
LCLILIRLDHEFGMHSFQREADFTGAMAMHSDCPARPTFYTLPARDRAQSLWYSFDCNVLQSFIGALSVIGSDLAGNHAPMTPPEKEAVARAARLFRDMGATQIFMFGSAAKGQLRPDSDIDMAVSGLPPGVYFSAVNQASDLVGRPVDLMDLDDDMPLIRHLRARGELVRVS